MLAETLRLNTTLTLLDLGVNGLGEGGGRALAETLRLNTTLTSLDLFGIGLRDDGGRALAETLRLSTTLTLVHLGGNHLGVGIWQALAETLAHILISSRRFFLWWKDVTSDLGLEGATSDLANSQRLVCTSERQQV